jgi:hypothetical protein
VPAGVDGIVAARAANDAVLTIADINPKALFLASINAEAAGIRLARSSVAPGPNRSTVRLGGDAFPIHDRCRSSGLSRRWSLFGASLSLDWTIKGAALLSPQARLIMHTGVSKVGGRDVLLEALRERLPVGETELAYRELDPDIFGDELEQPQYWDVERIAVVRCRS